MTTDVDQPEEPPRRYRWPWIALAILLMGVVSAVIFMTVAVEKLKHESDYSTPLPGTAPLR